MMNPTNAEIVDWLGANEHREASKRIVEIL